MAKTTKAKSEKPKATAAAAKKDVVRTPRVLLGLVVSNKMQKTAVMKVDRQVMHPVYMKYVVRSKKYKIHDEANEAQVGDYISAVETRPMSRHKRFRLKEILRKSRTAQLNLVEVDAMADVSKEALAERSKSAESESASE